MVGCAGNDILSGEVGGDLLLLENASDLSTGGAGTDTISDFNNVDEGAAIDLTMIFAGTDLSGGLAGSCSWWTTVWTPW